MKPDHLFNRTQFNFFAKLLRTNGSRFKKNKTCEWIVAVHRIGKIDNGEWVYSEKDRADIIALVRSQLQVDLLFDDYPSDKSRVERAKTKNDEKTRSIAVSHDFVLVNSIGPLLINGQQNALNEIESLGTYININSIQSIEHKVIVLVENLSVMANLSKLIFTDDNDFLNDALWLYRGDLKPQHHTGQSYSFFRCFKQTHQLLCFADFDPKGLEIALTSGATRFITPTIESINKFNVVDADIDYFKQDSARQFIENEIDNQSNISSLYEWMSEHRKTIKQEHMIGQQLPLTVFELNNDDN